MEENLWHKTEKKTYFKRESKLESVLKERRTGTRDTDRQELRMTLFRRSQQREGKVTRLSASGKVPLSVLRPKGAVVCRVRIHLRSLDRRLGVEKALSMAKKTKSEMEQGAWRKWFATSVSAVALRISRRCSPILWRTGFEVWPT